MVSREGPYKTELQKRIKDLFPGCEIFKLDSAHTQGVPDMLILFLDRWAVLEVKRSADASIRPNQPYWIRVLGQMSFAAFIYPENEAEVLDELQQAFESR